MSLIKGRNVWETVFTATFSYSEYSPVSSLKMDNKAPRFVFWQRLSGASLLILANKQDINGALTPTEIAKVKVHADVIFFVSRLSNVAFLNYFWND